LPESELTKLDIRPTSTESFILANGEEIELKVGNAYFNYRGKTRSAPVVFGQPGVLLLGATTLGALGLILDPVNRQLTPLPMTLMRLR
ncbi:MAG: aspartyl protease, partial [Candidatus Hydrogenedentes bacterium]|nr:aspartyl protease [Candidatus Hydrogenedentota bacterium]